MPSLITEQSTALRVALYLVALFIYSLLETMLAPVLPEIGKALTPSIAKLGWVFSGLLFSGAVATPVIGRLADIYDKRLVVTNVLVIVCIGVALAGAAQTIEMLVLAEVLQGVGIGLVPVSVGAIGDSLPAKRAGVAGGLVVATLTASTAVGLLLSGPISSAWGFRGIFWMTLAPLASCAVATYRLRSPRPVAKRELCVDWAGAGLLAAWMVAILLLITHAPKWGWVSIRVACVYLLAAVVFALLLLLERKQRSALLDLNLLVRPSVAATCVIAFAVGFGSLSSYIIVPLLAQANPRSGIGLGASVSQAANYLLPFAIGGTLVAPAAASLRGRFGSKFVVVAGGFALVCGVGSLALWHSTGWHLASGMALVGVAVGSALTEAINVSVTAAGREFASSISAIVYVVRNIGGTTGVQVSASIMDSTANLRTGLTEPAGFVNALVIAAIVSTATILAGLSLRTHR